MLLPNNFWLRLGSGGVMEDGCAFGCLRHCAQLTLVLRNPRAKDTIATLEATLQSARDLRAPGKRVTLQTIAGEEEEMEKRRCAVGGSGDGSC